MHLVALPVQQQAQQLLASTIADVQSRLWTHSGTTASCGGARSDEPWVRGAAWMLVVAEILFPSCTQCSRRRSNYWVTVYSTEMIKVLHGAEAEGVQLGRVEPWQ